MNGKDLEKRGTEGLLLGLLPPSTELLDVAVA